MLNHRHGEPSPRDAQTQGFTNKGHVEGGICRFVSTDTRTQRLRIDVALLKLLSQSSEILLDI